MGEKSSKEYSIVFLMEGEKFNLGEKNEAIKFRRKVQICLVGSVRTRSAHRLSSQLFVVVSTPSWCFLVFSVHSHGFYGVPNTFCQEKHQHFHADRQLVTKKEISIKINFQNDSKRSWPSGTVSGLSRPRAEFGSRRGQEINFLFLFFLFNDLNESIFTNL